MTPVAGRDAVAGQDAVIGPAARWGTAGRRREARVINPEPCGRMCRRSNWRQSSRPSGHRISAAQPPRYRAHATIRQGRQLVSLYSTSAVRRTGARRGLSISSPAGTRVSIGTVPTGGG